MRGDPTAWIAAVVWGDMLLGATAAVVALGAVRSVVVRAVRRRGPGPDPLDDVLGRLARPVPIDEALQQVVDALRRAPGRRAVELWQRQGDELVLTHASPLVDRTPAEVPAAAVRVAASVGVVGDTWLGTWIPGLTGVPGADRTRAVPLATRSELAGAVLLRREPDEQPFTAADDDRLLRIQRPLAAVLNQDRLTAALRRNVETLEVRNRELQASRARLVSVADAERRRLERDLHDGAQARLTALAVRLQLVRRLVEADPSRVDELLGTIEAELVDAAAELRTLAHGIVPPLLLTGGLGDALRGAAGRSPVEVHVDVRSGDRYRPEVEAAVYYCCVEAIQNVVKHGGPAARATVTVTCDGDRLRFAVTDDGRGLGGEPAAAGHGLLNMSDRIGALGGTVTIGPGPSGLGVQVTGQVPVEVAAR